MEKKSIVPQCTSSKSEISVTKITKINKFLMLLFGIFFAFTPVLAYILLKHDIHRVLNAIDSSAYLTLFIVIVLVLSLLAIRCFYYAFRKASAIKKYYIFSQKLRIITIISIIFSIIYIVVMLLHWPQYFLLSILPVILVLLYFYKNLHKNDKITNLGKVLTVVMMIIMLILPTFLVTHSIIWRNNYRKEISFLNDIALTIDVKYGNFGGWSNPPNNVGFESVTATGFFQVQKINDVWWFVDPEGYPFISKGINHVSYWDAHYGDKGAYAKNNDKKYESYQAWEVNTKQRIKEWNFNTITSWSDPELYYGNDFAYTILIDFAGQLGVGFHDGTVVDVFCPEFEEIVDQTAFRICTSLKDDPYLLGYFTDNELIWGPDWRTNKSLLQLYFELPDSSSGKKYLLEFLREKSLSIDEFNNIWGTSINDWNDINSLSSNHLSATNSIKANDLTINFAALVSSQYSEITTQAIKHYDPNHLVLGCRYAFYPGDYVVAATSEYFDVISLASYSLFPPLDELDKIYDEIDKPFIIEEFSFNAYDSKVFELEYSVRNFLTQNQRSVAMSNYIRSFMSRPYAIGYHWYKWCDNPDGLFKLGANCGLVNSKDEPYTELVDVFTLLNYLAEDNHLKPQENE